MSSDSISPKKNNEVKRETIMVLLFAFYFVISTAFFAISSDQKRDDVLYYKQKQIQIQLKYEEVRGEFQNVQRDLADAQERLAKAAARDKAARGVGGSGRASRSRGAGTRVPSIQRSVAQPRMYSDGLHDITMYCPTGNSTASGKTPQRGMVATISRSIPFGTHILIEGYGEYIVEDRIGHGSEFDIFTPSCAEADRFGRKHARVTILR